MGTAERWQHENVQMALKAIILRHTSENGTQPTELPEVFLSRFDTMHTCTCAFGKPSVGIILQGSKQTIVGRETFAYHENQCLVIGMDMPSSFAVTQASPERPFLACSFFLDRLLLSELITQSGLNLEKEQPGCACVADLQQDVLETLVRLLSLLDKPEQIPVRAPLILRELHYLLLIGPQGSQLRKFNTLGSHSQQIAQAVGWLREHYCTPQPIELLAGQFNMSASAFHRHFKEVTGFSPLQYLKKLRLYEAQRLMLTQDHSVATAAYAVGYESPTQFSREYKRLFGNPPHRDIAIRRPQD